ncbi:MAG: DUF4115 domain-containing protein [Aphanocapsa lilacina HA4352-LM1]|jgi:cytoskeletal protein RodZ|nr:DUF4115 domain-containing protein [Aphanocapsa lilacina HA4352-LM1]
MTTESFQPDSLKSVGSLLAKGRQQRGWSVDDVSERTRIPRRYLLAIESGQTDHLPEPVYVRAFIRKYSDLVELNGTELLRELQPAAAIAEAVAAGTPIERASASLDKPTLRPFHAWLLYGALVIVALGGFSYLQRSQEPEVISVVKPTQPAPAKPAQGKAQKPPAKPANQGAGAFGPSALASKGLQMQLAMTQASWVRVIADGRKAFEGELPVGAKRDWRAEKQFTVRAGNAGGVLITLNDRSLGQLGKSGEVVERVFRPEP